MGSALSLLARVQTPVALALVALVAADDVLALGLSDAVLALALLLAGALGLPQPKDAAKRLAQAARSSVASVPGDETVLVADSGHVCDGGCVSADASVTASGSEPRS